MIFESFEALQVFWGSGPKKYFATTSKSLRYEENLREIARGLTYFLTHSQKQKRNIYIYYIPWTSRPWEFPGSMGIHGVFRENTVHLIFQVFFPALSALESIMQYKITHNPDMWCQGSCWCHMQILNFYTSDLSGDVRGWKKTNKNSPILTHANPWKTLGICMCLHGFFMGIAWVQHGWGIPSVFRFRNPIPGVLL